MRKTSYLALVAAAGLFGATIAPANAADLGGGCCADLEERVAELEATTARKGNRVVSLQLYGQVNKALLVFDDGDESDVFVVDNDQSGSRIGFLGKATIKPGWSAGYNIELDIQDSATNLVDQLDDEGDENEIKIRKNVVYIESEQLGRVSLGQQSAATDGISEIILANSLSDSSDIFGAFRVAGSTVSAFVSDFDGPREDVIRYDTPSIYGFVLSASWGDDDFFDVALRFKKEFNSIRVAAGIGYQNFENKNNFDAISGLPIENDGVEIVSGSASAMHVPTGLYVAASAGQLEADNQDNEETFWYVQAGIEKRFFSYGATTVYGEYGLYEDQNGEGSEAERFGFGVVQTIDSAAMDLYANARFYDFESAAGVEDELSTLLIGSRIKF
jgi:predicted porin